MSEHDENLGHAYRALAKEEPPAALDAAILAAARRAVARPSLARRWAVPVSLAATLVLVVGVTLEMQREQPGIEIAPPQNGDQATFSEGASQSAEANVSAAPEAKPPVPKVKRETAPRPGDGKDRVQGSMPIAKPHAAAPGMAQPAREAPRNERFAPTPPPVAAQMAPPAAARAPEPVAPATPAARSSAQRAAGASVAKDLAATANPLDALEKIAKLRDEGRDVEADRALEEFRKRHPDYRIEDALWQRVRPR